MKQIVRTIFFVLHQVRGKIYGQKNWNGRKKEERTYLNGCQEAGLK